MTSESSASPDVLPPQQAALLAEIRRVYAVTQEPVTASYLARRFKRHHETIREQLAALHAKGYLVAETSPAIPR
jgi:predicted HTH transcriptional regulator